MPTINARKISSNDQWRTHVPGTSSTPVAKSRRHPGGRCNVPRTWWKSCAHPTAGMSATSAPFPLDATVRVDREVALTDLDPGLSLPSAIVVMNWSCPRIATRPSCVGGAIVSRDSRFRVPVRTSCTV